MDKVGGRMKPEMVILRMSLVRLRARVKMQRVVMLALSTTQGMEISNRSSRRMVGARRSTVIGSRGSGTVGTVATAALEAIRIITVGVIAVREEIETVTGIIIMVAETDMIMVTRRIRTAVPLSAVGIAEETVEMGTETLVMVGTVDIVATTVVIASTIGLEAKTITTAAGAATSTAAALESTVTVITAVTTIRGDQAASTMTAQQTTANKECALEMIPITTATINKTTKTPKITSISGTPETPETATDTTPEIETNEVPVAGDRPARADRTVLVHTYTPAAAIETVPGHRAAPEVLGASVAVAMAVCKKRKDGNRIWNLQWAVKEKYREMNGGRAGTVAAEVATLVAVGVTVGIASAIGEQRETNRRGILGVGQVVSSAQAGLGPDREMGETVRGTVPNFQVNFLRVRGVDPMLGHRCTSSREGLMEPGAELDHGSLVGTIGHAQGKGPHRR